MRVVDLYLVLDDNIYIKIIDEDRNVIMWGKPCDIPVSVLYSEVKSIKLAENISIADIEITIRLR